MVIMVMGMENVVTLNGVDDDGVILGDDAYLQVNIAMTATYMIFGLSLFWMVFHLVQVNFRTSSAKCFHHFFHSFHSSQSIIRGGKITPYYESYQHSLIILLLMYLNPKGEVKNKVKSIAMKLGIVKTEEDDYLD